MTTLAKHFERLSRYQRHMEDEVHRMHDEDHVNLEHGNYFVNLSDEIHTVRQGIERVKGFIGIEDIEKQ